MRCNHYGPTGRCKNTAAIWICTPDGKRVSGGYECRKCAGMVIKEYREKLKEDWHGMEIDELGRDIPGAIFRGDA